MLQTIPNVRLPVKPNACRLSDEQILTFRYMKPITQIRRDRLRELVAEAGTQAAVALRIGKDKNQIYQWLLTPGTEGARNIGSRSAKILETAFAKPEGWMDSDPEAFGSMNESLATHDYRQSRAARPTAAILAEAVRVLDVDETVNGKYPPLKHAELLLEVCDRLAAGGDAIELIAQITKQRTGETNGTTKTGARR
jgi:hypothetical protein